MAIKFKLKKAFRHSYSKEFGYTIDKDNPERYMIRYNITLPDGSMFWSLSCLHLTYHSICGANGNHYWLSSLSDSMDEVFKENNISSEFYTLKEAKNIINNIVKHIN